MHQNLIIAELICQTLVTGKRRGRVLDPAKVNPQKVVSHSYIEENKDVVFFSDNHLFGYRDKDFQMNFVPRSTCLPLQVVPRPEFPDGRIRTVEDYIKLLYNGATILKSDEELFAFLVDNPEAYTAKGTK